MSELHDLIEEVLKQFGARGACFETIIAAINKLPGIDGFRVADVREHIWALVIRGRVKNMGSAWSPGVFVYQGAPA